MDREQAIKFIQDLLRQMVKRQASDMFITVGVPPMMKVDGKVQPIGTQALTDSITRMISRAIMSDKQSAEFERTLEVNFAIAIQNLARFRVNAFMQRSQIGMVLRVINSKVPDFEKLNLPPILKEIAMTKRGLVMFVGATGSGKSTSLASMIDYRNQNSYGHIITIEDPIEFTHEHKNCVITQREVGVDTDSFAVALKNTLRQAPDVILIGEIRDREAMDHAIAFAETGHLCLSTLHANSTNQALDRIINFFPEERRPQLLMDLSLNLKAFISQRLLPKQDGSGRVAAVEVMINTPLIQDLIFKGDVHEIKPIIAKSREMGMQTFDQALFELYENNMITMEDALRNSDQYNDLRLQMKLNSKRFRGEQTESGPTFEIDRTQENKEKNSGGTVRRRS